MSEKDIIVEEKDRLARENRALRAALERIAAQEDNARRLAFGPGPSTLAVDMAGWAKEALERAGD